MRRCSLVNHHPGGRKKEREIGKEDSRTEQNSGQQSPEDGRSERGKKERRGLIRPEPTTH